MGCRTGIPRCCFHIEAVHILPMIWKYVNGFYYASYNAERSDGFMDIRGRP